MPGSVRGELYEMALTDALTLLALGTAQLQMLTVADEVDELRRAAQAVVEAHGADVVARYAPKLEPSLRVVRRP